MNRETDPPAPAPVSRQVGARDFLTIVFRRKWIILGLFVIVTVTVTVLTIARPVSYASFGSVLVKRGEQESVMTPGRRVTGWEEELATEAQVVKSWAVRAHAQRLLDEAALRGAPALRLDGGGVDVQVIGQSNVIEIAYVSRDPEIAHRACDAIMNAYVEYRSTSESLPYPKKFFDGELKGVSAAIDSLSRVRRQFTESEDLVDVGEQGRSLIETFGNRTDDRARISGDLAQASARLRTLSELHNSPDMDVPVIGAGFLNESALSDLKLSMLRQETRIAQLQERYREDAPELVDARASLESMRGLLRREVAQALKLAQAEVQGLRSRLETIDQQIAGLQSDLAEMPKKESRLQDIDQRLTVLKARLLAVTHDSDRARVTEQTSRRVSIVVLSPASAGREQNSHDYVRLALAPAFSLVVGIGLAFFIDGLDTRLRTARDVEDTVDLPVFASLTERKD
jgi:uncharacterized protein involved in exopolysaccharide biosynthesis